MATLLCAISAVFIVYLLYKVLDWAIRLPRVGQLNDRYILVTGCDTGFGNATAKKLDGLGCHVFAACFTESGEVDLRKSCSDRLKVVHLDVTSHESVLKAFQYVKQHIPEGRGLWGLLNNAGIAGKVGPTEWLSARDFQQVMAVNLYGIVDITNTFMPLLKQARGRVVSTASVFGRCSLVGSAPYTCSKFAVESLMDCYRREMGVFNVSAHLIEPGFHKTNIIDKEVLKRALRASWDQISEDLKAQYGEDFIKKSEETISKGMDSPAISQDISGVVNAYTHALIGMFPRARYLVGMDAKFFWLPISWLPEWLGDRLLIKINELQGAPKPAICRS